VNFLNFIGVRSGDRVDKFLFKILISHWEIRMIIVISIKGSNLSGCVLIIIIGELGYVELLHLIILRVIDIVAKVNLEWDVYLFRLAVPLWVKDDNKEMFYFKSFI